MLCAVDLLDDPRIFELFDHAGVDRLVDIDVLRLWVLGADLLDDFDHAVTRRIWCLRPVRRAANDQLGLARVTTRGSSDGSACRRAPAVRASAGVDQLVELMRGDGNSINDAVDPADFLFEV